MNLYILYSRNGCFFVDIFNSSRLLPGHPKYSNKLQRSVFAVSWRPPEGRAGGDLEMQSSSQANAARATMEFGATELFSISTWTLITVYSWLWDTLCENCQPIVETFMAGKKFLNSIVLRILVVTSHNKSSLHSIVCELFRKIWRITGLTWKTTIVRICFWFSHNTFETESKHHILCA